ncbi:conserved hypothetical protein [Candidatus Jettenia caeni]|uniref:Uncharacterized protein n=2 Tax=Candidatus Jettenia TaxID=360731 RepID=I3IRM2_9BACT|nr:conserved hypothetical protein [Candidatus Jettenia caeni]GAB64367.1 conserved hypothetical protein [Candidatus Jettenia caeni]
MTMPNKNSQLPEPSGMPGPHVPTNTWKHMIVFLCIWFLIVALVLIYFTITGSPQAGLLEVGVSTLIFILLFHLVIKFFPAITKILTYVLVIGFGIALIFVNYHFLKAVKKDASLEQLLVGDLLVHKIMNTVKREPTTTITEKEAFRYQKLLLETSLDQLKKLVADPLMADFQESLSVTRVRPMVQEGIVSLPQKYQLEQPVDMDRKENISHLKFMTAGYDSMIRGITGEEDVSLLPVVTQMPMITGEIRSVIEHYEIGLPVTSLSAKISGLKFIQEPLHVTLEAPAVQSPVFETISSISLITLSEPLQEGYLRID